MEHVGCQPPTCDKLPLALFSATRLFGTLTPYRHLLHCLPHEILAAIFLAALQGLDDQYDAIMTSVTLSHVCARWRHVARSTRGLWTNILITFPISYGQISLAVMFLNLSGSYPLDILLDMRDPSWNWEEVESAHGLRWSDMDLVLRILLIHVRRWCHFQLLSDTWMPIYSFFSHTHRVARAPMLETISLSRCNAYFASKDAVFSPVETGRPVAFFGGLGFEKLREVGLIGVHVDWAGSSSSLRNLTVLELKYLAGDVAPSIHEFIEMLCASPNLQHLSIVGRGPKIDVALSEEGFSSGIRTKVHLGKLKRFMLGFAEVDYALRLLPLFSFPALEELILEGFSMDYSLLEHISPDATPILEWLSTGQRADTSRITPPSPSTPIPLTLIKTLSLDGINASEAVLSRFFNQLKGLERLYLSNMDEKALKALATSTNDSVLLPCPRLQELDWGGNHLEAFIAAIKARAKLVSYQSTVVEPTDQIIGCTDGPNFNEALSCPSSG